MQFLEQWGILGLFLASFGAATILPFSSEALFAYMVSQGKSIYLLIFVATVGTSLGGLFNYWIGHLGNLSWAYKYLKISKESVYKWQNRLEKHGSVLAFLCWLPIVGDPLSLALGYFRVGFWKVALFLSLGKLCRYLFVYYVVTWFQ